MVSMGTAQGKIGAWRTRYFSLFALCLVPCALCPVLCALFLNF